MTKQDEDVFKVYLCGCTDAQVRDIYDKEKAAGRLDLAQMAVAEAIAREVPALYRHLFGAGRDAL